MTETKTLMDAVLLGEVLSRSASARLSVAAAALLLREIEKNAGDGTDCPLCAGQWPASHMWQCDLAGALDELDAWLK